LNFAEFMYLFNPSDARTQAARCMDCGIPFCHAGIQLDGASVGCPLGNMVPEINDLTYRGKYTEAYRRLRLTHPFPEFTGRICPAPCEGSCTLGEHEQPVAIKAIERFLDDYAAAHPRQFGHLDQPEARTDRKVAVIGSGPAGLAAAYYLNALGEQVTVFEGADRPGGLLMYGVPAMKLGKDVVLRVVQRLEAAGIEFKLESPVGDTVDAEWLLEQFDALVLCTGAPLPRMPNIEGGTLKGFYPAMLYLTYATKRLLDPHFPAQAELEATGKDVFVVGNGDTATDCVATALRQGARSLTQLYYRNKPPIGRGPRNPWPLYPRVLKTDYGQQEAIALFGCDPREYARNIIAAKGDANGSVESVLVADVEWHKDAEGLLRPHCLPADARWRPAQLVLIATGFAGPDRRLLKLLGLETDVRGNVATQRSDSYATSRRRVFVAGDAHRGSSLVVWALKEGRDAARQCHQYLNESAGH
jgi:glutamate synthase (NADPH/NADH) small chain